ncbi:C4-dicarboxylate transporter/malic acid transport protein [Actinoplanes friuliensis DSM 7358]|uniref:C4-dicarboxylate transporter/malic acid transport protein n=1 Tax=Actinoplanes friuliensis DSM 7358 TaxID=1246995 RepID=U5W2H7_9ACTN|nr:C4-dicarboxylate transporter/malic acid transport protein [Actinoplanes friuliensis DSM 7358]
MEIMTALLERPARRTTPVTLFGPNWFASVMGTGIVATAAASLPVHVPGLRVLATVVWALAAVLLVVLLVATVRHRTSYADDPVLFHFWGAPPMALMTVGAGTLLLGRDWLGEPLAVVVDLVLWTAGTGFGLVVAVLVPYRMMTRTGDRPDAAFGGWLMPVVSPMVSAATGALLVPHVPARTELLLACYAMVGISLFAALVVISQIWGRLVRHGVGPARLVPTLWIVLGPLGQSVTAVHLLGRASDGVLSEPYAQGAQLAALLYGVPVLGFAAFWAALAGAITVRTARAGLPFSLTWWSFTFPVGTVVTGVSGLAVRTGSALLTAVAVLLYAALVAAWTVVATRTLRGVRRGDLLKVAPPA